MGIVVFKHDVAVALPKPYEFWTALKMYAKGDI
jgi:hypothetical protein